MVSDKGRLLSHTHIRNICGKSQVNSQLELAAALSF
jgi:hypothetical protein